jgi:predicted dehydrogenase
MPLRAALIGAGPRAHVHLAAIDGLAESGSIELVAVADPAVDAARAVATPRGAAVHDDPADLLSSHRIDVAYLVVPYHLHPVLISAILDRDVHLLVEKPWAVQPADTAELARLADRAASRGVLTCVGYDRCYARTFDRCVELLQDEPAALFASHWYWGIPPSPWARRFDLNGGQVFAQLSHHVDLARHLLGEVTSVYAASERVARITPDDERAGFDNHDVVSISLRFASGAVGNVHGTYALFPGVPDAQAVRIIGRDRLIDLEATHLRVTRPGPEGVPPTPEILEVGDDRMPRMHNAFMRAIVEGRPELIRTPAADAAMTSYVCAAANESARTGRPVVVADMVAQHRQERSQAS